MESETGMKDDNVNIDGHTESADSFGLTLLAQSLKQIDEQANVSKADVPARLPTMTNPVKTLQYCLDPALSGVLVSRKEMLDGLDPIYREINRMKKSLVVKKLAMVNINTWATTEVLKYRLKSYYNQLRVSYCHKMLPDSQKMKFDYLLVIDFERTYETSVKEIIEFPVVLVDTRSQTICGGFHKFCKPRVHPVLKKTCTTLTGITQAQVDDAKDFTELLKEFNDWLLMLRLGTDYKFAVVIDGSWHMVKMFKLQLQLAGIDLPWWATQWVNMRKVYRAFYGSGYVHHLKEMVHKSGMEFEGRPRCGIHDALDLAAVAITLLRDGCIFTFNEHFCNVSNVRLSRTSEPLHTNPSSESNEAQDESISKLSEPVNTNPSSDSEAQGESLTRLSEPVNTNPSESNEAQDESISRLSEPVNTNPSESNEAQDESISRLSEPVNTNPSESNEAQDESLSGLSEPINMCSSTCNEVQVVSHKNQESKIDMTVLFDSCSIFVVMLLMFLFQGHLNP